MRKLVPPTDNEEFVPVTLSVESIIVAPVEPSTLNLLVSTTIPPLALIKPEAVISEVVVTPVTSNVPPSEVAPVPTVYESFCIGYINIIIHRCSSCDT